MNVPKRIRIVRYARIAPTMIAAALCAVLLSSNGCGRSFFNEISGTATQTVAPTGSSSATATGPTASFTPTGTSGATMVATMAAANAATASPTPWAAQFLYASNFTDATISEFSRSDSGALTLIGKTSAGAVNGPVGIAVHPSGKFLYAANQADQRVYQFAIGSDGELTPIGAGSVVAGSGPQMIAIDSTAAWLYLTTTAGSVFQFSIDQTSGALTALGNPVGGLGKPFGIVAHPSRNFVYAADNAGGLIYAFTINSDGTLAQNGDATAVSSGHPGLMAIAADSGSQGFLFAQDLANGVASEFTIGADGRLTAGKTAGSAQSGKFVGIGATSQNAANYLFTTESDSNSVQLFSRDGAALTPIGSDAAASAPAGAIADPEGKFIYAADSGSGTITQLAIKGGCGKALCAVATVQAENPSNPNAGTQFLAVTP
jgi:DNA-binding beta-propeller fold protein YncE